MKTQVQLTRVVHYKFNICNCKASNRLTKFIINLKQANYTERTSKRDWLVINASN